ncbi:MAG: prepilin-type N-terminal cleavage/methylation domain-containing protein [Patescibacteria group bacterium]
MRTIFFQRRRAGQSLVELLVAIAVAAVMLPAIITGVVASREGKIQQRERLSATALLREGEEAVRTVREGSWTAFAVNGTFHPVVSGGTWILASGSETVDQFTRSIVISDVYRDALGAVTSSGGTMDPSTKQVVTTVAWNAIFPSSVSGTSYLTRYSNATYIQTSEADFFAGTVSNAVITNTAGGEVTLGAGGRGDWCAPNLSIAALDLPKQGVANTIWAVPGHISAGTGENASGVSYAHVTVSDTIPPVATVDGTFDGYKTNAIWTDASYTYIATDNNFKEVVILGISGTPAETGYFNAPGNGNGQGVFVSGATGYVTSASTLYTFDASGTTGSRPLLGSIGLVGPGKAVRVVGSYAYVVIDSPATQLQIIDVSNPQSPAAVGQAQVAGGSGRDVFVNTTGTRVYLVTESSASQTELFIVDISIKTGNAPVVGTYDTQGMNPKGITVVTGNKVIVVGTGAEEYQVVNITDETNPARCGGLSIDSGINGVASVQEADGDAYSYSITGDATSELKIIEGGPGGKYSQSGIFESATFDATASAAFNRLDFTATAPPQTGVTVQIAGADPVNGSCQDAVFQYVGPDGTAGSFFTAGGQIPLSSTGTGYKNPARCWRYKVTLSTNDFSQTPIFYDITVNYSP